MNKITTTLSVAAALAFAGAAQAQTLFVDWTLSYGGATGLNEVEVDSGETVLVEGWASWTDPFGRFVGSDFEAQLTGADMSDGIDFTSPGLGAPAALFTGVPFETAMMGGRAIDATSSQLPPFINPGADASNPIMFFSYEVTAGDAGRVIGIDSVHTTAFVSDITGLGQLYQASTDGARISVVPTPATAALFGLGGLACARRRR